MYFLSFETSSKIFSIALNKDEKVLRYRNLKSAFLLEDFILPMVDKVLDSAGIKFSQLDGFAIARGPGSFTSLRVGLAIVKAFAMGTGKPVAGIPTLDILARGVQTMSFPRLRAKREAPKGKRESITKFDQYDEICVINDARRDKVYACLYGPQGRKSDYLLTSLEDVLKRVKGRTLFTGDALLVYRPIIEGAYAKHASKKDNTCKCFFADKKWWYPQARVMAALAYERFKAKQYDDAANLLPLYLYPQDCQVTTPMKLSPPNENQIMSLKE